LWMVVRDKEQSVAGSGTSFENAPGHITRQGHAPYLGEQLYTKQLGLEGDDATAMTRSYEVRIQYGYVSS